MNNSSYEKYIISSSENLSVFKRILDILLTIILWAIYIYLMWDFFTYVHQLLGWWFQSSKIGRAPDLKVLHTMLVYAETIAIMGLTLIGWALYNLMRFRGKGRRKEVPVVKIDAIAEMYKISPKDLETWQKKRILVMHHDQHGKITKVDVTA